MHGRTILALVLAPIVAGAMFSWLVLSSVPMSAIQSEHRPELLVQFVVGLVSGAVFELFFLLPLLYVLRRTHVSGRLLFISSGIFVWFLVYFGLLSLGQLDWNGRFATSLMFLVPGAALVVAFGAIVQHGAKA
jgi:hypothetical protein